MLTKYELVNTKGLKGVYFDGRMIPFDKIDDELAEQLEGKTHVLKKRTGAAATKAQAALTAGSEPK